MERYTKLQIGAKKSCLNTLISKYLRISKTLLSLDGRTVESNCESIVAICQRLISLIKAVIKDIMESLLVIL